MKRKTIKLWLETIKDKDVREKAFINARKHNTYKLEEYRGSFMSALKSAFSFQGTPEGHSYWYELAMSFE